MMYTNLIMTASTEEIRYDKYYCFTHRGVKGILIPLRFDMHPGAHSLYFGRVLGQYSYMGDGWQNGRVSTLSTWIEWLGNCPIFQLNTIEDVAQFIVMPWN